MLHTIVSENDIFLTSTKTCNKYRSTNPYDYIRFGYFLDNASLFGGSNNVNFNCNISGNSTSTELYIANK